MTAARGEGYGSILLGPVDQGTRRLRARLQLLLTVLLVGTNLIGALIVFVLSVFVLPGPRPSHATLVALAISVPVYVAVAVVVGATLGTALALKALRWVQEDETPSHEDRLRALKVPWYLTLMQASLWSAATVLFTVLAAVVQPERALSTGFAVGITSVVVSAIAYLLSELSLRPVSARALEGETVRASAFGVRRRMLLFWGLGTGAPVTGLLIVGALTLTQQQITLDRLAIVILTLTSIVLVFGYYITALNAGAVVAPILAVRNAMQQVEDGDFDVSVEVYDGTELGQLQAGFNQMVGGLREREHLRDLFGRHVGKEVAAAAADKDVELGGETRVVSVLFIDIVGSTTLAAERDPAEVVDLLNRFFGVVVEEVDRRQGLVNKFIGDAALAVFGAPNELPDHAARALAAARSMAQRLADEVGDLDAGIGVSTGEAVAGNVGEESRFEYTVIGDAVNSAARLTELAKDVEGRVLASWASVEAARESGDDEADHWKQHDTVTLRGRSEETTTAVPEW